MKRGGASADTSTEKALSWNAILSTYLPAMVLALGVGIAVPAIPKLAESFGVSFGVATWVITAFLVGNLAGAVPTGWLVDRFGRRPIMIAGPILTAAMAFMTAAATSFPELIFYRFLDGVAAQMWLIGRLAAISKGAPANQRGRQVSWMFGMNNVGKLTGPLAGGFIAVAWGLRAPFIAYGILALLALIPTYLYAQDTPRREKASAGSGATGVGAKPRTLTLRAIVAPRMIYFVVVFVAALARGPVQADLLHLYAAFAYGLDAKTIGYLAAAAGVVALPIGFVAGWMMDRFGRKATMVPGFCGLTVAMGLLALSAFLHFALLWYVALFLIGVAAQALTGGSIQTIGADVAPPEARGYFLGLWRFVGQCGATLSPILFALLADGVSYGASFLYITAAAAVVAYLLIRHIPETGEKATKVVGATPAQAPA